MKYEEALAWVHSLPRLAQRPGVENEKRLLAKLGHPERALKFAHIAGTNGKGSTSVMLASILRAAGYKTGLTVSPYVLDFRERFQIDGAMIGEEALAAILTRVRAAAEALRADGWDSLVEFDAVTAAALLWFAQEQCDIVVLETGLGGRLDATNAVENTLVACITAIGMDHTELLGDTLDAIAREKCGIFKRRCAAVCYPDQPQEAMDAIVQCAKAAGCTLRVPEKEDFYFYKAPPFENRVDYGGYDLVIPFPGRHQAYNAGVAIEASFALCEQGFDIPDEAILQGVASARFPARIEVLSTRPPIVLDGMHNPAGARALAEVLRAAGARDMTAVVGILRGKGEREMLEILSPYVRRVYTVAPNTPRAIPAEELAEAARPYFAHVSASASLPLALRDAAAHMGGGLLICGSLYLAAEARPFFVKG